MYFEDLTIEEKVECTMLEFKRRDKLAAKGKKEAGQYIFQNQCRIRSKLKGEKRGSMRG